MVLFLYGEDTYRSKKKLDDIRVKFLRDIDPSGLNVTVIEGGKDQAETLRTAMSTAPFLAKKRLVILKNSLKSAKKAMAAELDGVIAKTPEETILVIHEEVGAEDLAGNPVFERLKKGKYYPEFSPLGAKQLTEWIAGEAKQREVVIAEDAARRLASAFGSDLWRISAELDKLAAYARSAGNPIDSVMVQNLTESRFEAGLFDFIDAVGVRQCGRAADLLEGLLAQGETEAGLLSRLQGHVRNLLLCKDALESGGLTKDRLSRELGIHPFVAGKVMNQCRYFSRRELTAIFDWLVEADVKMKTGGWSKPRMALDLFLLKLSEKAAVAA